MGLLHQLKRRSDKEHILALPGAQISLAASEGSLYKDALILYEGKFSGIYGEVTVTGEFLERMAERFNREFANPKNEHDYPPILKDHIRDSDLIKGRVVPQFSVREWENPRTGITVKALFGPIRIDDEDAQTKVKAGKYSHLSASFDEETAELFEVSFVAVEAARGAQALKRGEKSMNVELRLKALQKRHDAMVANVRALSEVRKASCLALGENLKAAESEATALSQAMVTAIGSLRTSALSAQLKGLIRQGKLSRAEFGKIDIQKISALPSDARQAVLAAYEARPVSADVFQYGQVGAKPVSLKANSPADVRKLIELQRSGKGAVLAADDVEKDDKDRQDPPAQAAGADDDKDSTGELKFEDVEEAIKAVEGLGGTLEKITASMKRMSETLKKLQEQEDKEPADKAEGEGE